LGIHRLNPPIKASSTKVMFISIATTNPDSIESGLVVAIGKNQENSLLTKDHFLNIERIKPYTKFIIVSWTPFN